MASGLQGDGPARGTTADDSNGSSSKRSRQASSSSSSSSSSAPAREPVELVLLRRDDAQFEALGVKRLANQRVPPGCRDLDYAHAHRSDYAPRLGADVIDHYRLLEAHNAVDAGYFATVQTEVTPSMRAVLVDWLHTLHTSWSLRAETLHAAVRLVDRFLSRVAVPRLRLQLAAIAALMAACKLEEQHPPALSDYVACCRGAYSEEEIRSAEARLCTVLDWRLRTVSSRTFLARFLDAAGARCGDRLANLTKLLGELALLEARFLHFSPSLVCAASIHAARRQLQHRPGPRGSAWTPTLQLYTGYTEEEVSAASNELLWAMRDARRSKLRSVMSKYALPVYGSVAETVQPLADTDSSSDATLRAEFPPDEPSHSCHAQVRRRRI